LDRGDDPDQYLGGFDPERHLIPAGQDLELARDIASRYHKLDTLLHAIAEAAHGHLRQAKHHAPWQASSELATSLGVAYPIVQGPMARVSDTPAFLKDVARAGGLPMLSLGLAPAEAAGRSLAAACDAVDGRPWGVGLLGFIPPAVYDAQAEQVLAAPCAPAAVVIAGGRPDQGKRFEAAGIAAFLHVPSPGLLDTYLKDGARRFIFEGRESGGHVGPLASTILWEQQIARLLAFDDPAAVSVLFAGGIHDAWSSAFVAIMAASLAARGAKIGLQIGSAYLTTTEAVTSGAITATYQELALASDHTVLLESAPGQDTRALPTPYADFFAAERHRLDAADMPSLARRTTLEELNLGRARVASKGLERNPATGRLETVPRADQTERGLFMIGAIVGLLHEPRTMVDLHAEVCDGADRLIDGLTPVVALADPEPALVAGPSGFVAAEEPIAIIGMAALFPQAGNVDEFWTNILMGKDTVTEVSPERWDPEIFYRPDTTDTDFVVSKWGGFLSPAEFDPLEFGITPASVSSIETAQLLSLLVAKRALQDAGYADRIKEGLPDTSVIFGVEAMGELSSAYGSRPGLRSLLGDLPPEVSEILPKLDEDSFAGILSNVTSGRIANRLNCGGRNFTVDAACASSLAALDVACQELWNNRAGMVICGGTDLHNSILDYTLFCSTYALSKRGYCATFDEAGDGLALGEGCGVLILKRLGDAERDGDKIYAVIRSIDGASDGRSLGLTAPNMAGQTSALRRAYERAGVLPSEVGLIEAHGTGTAVGDRAELSALSHVMLDAGGLPGETWLGSIKTQIGHAKCAAGVASVIKAALSVRHGVIPPTLHLERPVRTYKPGRSPFRFNANGHAIPWNTPRRIAGVSGFGFGGTDFHTIIQNYSPAIPDEPASPVWPCELFLARGDDAAEAQDRLRAVVALWDANHAIALKDVAFTLAADSDKPVQFCLVAGSWDELKTQIAAVCDGLAIPGVFTRNVVEGKVAFLFSGQGSQRVRAARDLVMLFPQLRMRLAGYPDLEALLFPPSVFSDDERSAQRAAVTDTRHAQPLLGLLDSGLAGLLTQFGIVPDAVAGHSYGELPALAYAGVIDPDDLVGLSAARAEAILGAVGEDPGAMVAIRQPQEATRALLEGRQDIWAVNLNAPDQVVIGGPTLAVDVLSSILKGRSIHAQRLDVACAFHTPLLAGADAAFAETLAHVRLRPPMLPVWSNTTAEPYPSEPAAIAARLAEHLVKPVRFSDELEAMRADGVRVFLEAGPGHVLTGLVSATLPDAVAIHVEDTGNDGLRTFLRALGRYVATGRDIDIEALFAGRGAERLDLADPARHATSPTTWLVDGLEAVPLARWREQGEKHIIRRSPYSADRLRSIARGESMTAQPESNPQPESATPPPPQAAAATPQPTPQPTAAPTVPPSPVPPAMPTAVPMPMPGPRDQLVFAYLQNMRAMLDDQRDIMLTALGFGGGSPAAGPTAEGIAAETYAAAGWYGMPPGYAYPAAPTAAPMAAPAPMPAAPVAMPAPTVEAPAAPPGQESLSPTDEPEDDDEGDEEEGSILPQIVDLTSDQMREIILEVVAEKTGYPVEMLGLDMDLEADLSIDSIKRLEIIGALGDKIDMPEPDPDETDAASALEALASIKTLRGMIEWLEGIGRELQARARGESSGTGSLMAAALDVPVEGDTDRADHPAAPAGDTVVAHEPDRGTPPSDDTDATAALVRLVWSKEPYPHSATTSPLTGMAFAVTDGPQAAVIAQELATHGAQARLVAPGEAPGPADGLVFIRDDRWGMPELFALLKGVGLSGVSRVLTVDDTPGRLGAIPGTPDLGRLLGLPGLVKTLQQEFPSVHVTSVTGLTPIEASDLPGLVAAELADPASWPDVAYERGARLRLVPVVSPAPDAPGAPAELDAASVVVVLGGAQGISPHILAHLAARVPCRFVLVGRTPRDSALAERYAALEDAAAIQRHLIDVEGITDPRQVSATVRAIVKAKAIEEALHRLGASGATASYASLDVRDATALRALLDQVREHYGRLDAVIHAAGALEDKLFRDKTWESFERVYETKRAPLGVLGGLMDELKLLVLFSSTAAAFGNRGQADYAAGNAALDQAASVLAARGGARVLAVAWGPWDGAGMVSPALGAQMRKRGLSLIPLDAGAEFFASELAGGTDPRVIAQAGDPTQFEVLIAHLTQGSAGAGA
ncbi:MAG: SDR family NAD(P)-dependent oxidoreductase, partial [Actinomycetia bacterium]|nr:SDR family NAD(P)-dependent oxidoreductase [Actinomycetes bacterium]